VSIIGKNIVTQSRKRIANLEECSKPFLDKLHLDHHKPHTTKEWENQHSGIKFAFATEKSFKKS